MKVKKMKEKKLSPVTAENENEQFSLLKMERLEDEWMAVEWCQNWLFSDEQEQENKLN